MRISLNRLRALLTQKSVLDGKPIEAVYIRAKGQWIKLVPERQIKDE